MVNVDDATVKDEAYILCDWLDSLRFAATSEAAIQRGIEEGLNEAIASGGGEQFQREYSLSARDRIDFFFPRVGIGLEVKFAATGGSLLKVAEQLARYAESPEIRLLIFASPSLRVISQLPGELNGKQLSVVRLHTGL